MTTMVIAWRKEIQVEDNANYGIWGGGGDVKESLIGFVRRSWNCQEMH